MAVVTKWKRSWVAVLVWIAWAAVPGGAEEYLLLDRAEVRVWWSYPPEKILKDQSLPETPRAERISICAAKGEFEPFVLLLRPRGTRPLMDVRFEIEPLRPPAGEKGAPISLEYQSIGYVHVDQPSGMSVLPKVGDRFVGEAVPFGSSGRTGYFPDRILPYGTAVAEVGENTQFWFTASIPRTAAAGRHGATMRLRLRGCDAISLPVEVVVYDFELPKAPSLKNTACWSPQYFTPPLDKAALKELYRDMAQHRQTPDPIVPQPEIKVGKDGTVEVDTRDYDEMVSYCMEELGLSHVFFPRVGGAWYTNVYFLWHTPDLTKQKWQGAPIFDESLVVTPEFRSMFGSYVKQMSDHFRLKGWAGRVYMTTMDEPEKPEDLAAICAFGRLVKSIAPETRLFCTMYPRPELLKVVDAWCPQQYDEALVRARQADGEELMFYKNWLHLVDMPTVNPRLYGWIAWRTKAVGWLTYATMGKWNRAWDEPYTIYPGMGIKAWGLGLWWYPDLLRPRILKSVRWEMMREGAEDYEYLACLARRLQSLPNELRDRPEARAARDFLDHAADPVILHPRVLPGGRDDLPDGKTADWKTRPAYATSDRVVWERRNEAARWIETLSRLGTQAK